MSVTQTLAIGLIVFFLYRFLLKAIGAEQFGIWSLVVATTGVAQIANLGLSGSVVKFVAKYVARGEYETASQVIQTACVTVGAFLALILLAGYPLAKWVLGWVIPAKSLPSALAILPWAFIAFWLLIVTSIFQAGLDGIQRIDMRASLLLAGAVGNLILCYILAPSYGLIGVAYARVAENLIVFFASWGLLKKNLKKLPALSFKWKKSIFREIFIYGTNFQIISLASMLHEPMTKAFLGKFGGLAMVGYYELASKMIWQLRALLVSGNQVLVPTFAGLQEESPEKIMSLYLRSYNLAFLLALPLYSLVVVCLPIISQLWIGCHEPLFILFSTLLSTAWLVNTLSIPAFFAYLGTGKLSWNVLGVVTMGLLNSLLGFFLGWLYGGNGVVYGWVISLILGSILIAVSYHIKNKVPLSNLIPERSWAIIIASLAATSASIIAQYEVPLTLKWMEIRHVIVVILVVIVFLPFWIHPVRKSITERITDGLLKRRVGA